MENNHIDYVEFSAHDLAAIQSFYSAVFAWEFTKYGPAYSAFTSSGLNGGFAQSEEPVVNGALIVLYHENLKETKAKILAANGTITKDIFSFPGGHRFQFTDPSGNELAVWSDKHKES